MTLESRTVVVVGGAGAVGEGIVRVLLQRDATVVAVDRSEAELALLTDSLGSLPRSRLKTLPVDLAAPGPKSDLRLLLPAVAPAVDDIVIALGGRPQPQGLESADSVGWPDRVAEFLRPHVAAARTLLPALGDGTYLTLMGSSALSAVRGEPLGRMQGAALRGWVEALRAESPRPAVCGLVIRVPVASRKLPRHDESWPSADDVGAVVGSMLEERNRRGIFELSTRVPWSPRGID